MDGKRLVRRVQLENILSFGPSTPPLELEPLNVLIGPNASGKSNFIEALSILAATPRDVQTPIREGGGTVEWLWKGSQDIPMATLEVIVENISNEIPLRYRLSFSELFARFTLMDEVVEDEHASSPDESPVFYYQYRGGEPVVRADRRPSSVRHLERGTVRFSQSILSQLRNPGSFNELEQLTETFEGMHFYREFQIGHDTPLRTASASRSYPRLPVGRRLKSRRGIELSAESTDH